MYTVFLSNRIILHPPAHPKNHYAIMESTWWRTSAIGNFVGGAIVLKDNKIKHSSVGCGWVARPRCEPKFRDS
jgi:hypothetical protein